MQEDPFLEDTVTLFEEEEHYFLFMLFWYYDPILHGQFGWDDEIHETYLEGCSHMFRTDLDNLVEETLLAYTFLYENLFIDDDADLNEFQIYLLELIKLMYPREDMYRRRLRLFIPFTGTDINTNKVYNNRLLSAVLEDAFVGQDDDVFESNYSLTHFNEFTNAKYFARPYIKKNKPRFLTYPRDDLFDVWDHDNFFIELTEEDENDFYLLKRKLFTAGYDVGLFDCLDTLLFNLERRKMRIKWHAKHTYKFKVKSKITKSEMQAILDLKAERKFLKQKAKEDAELFADLFQFDEDIIHDPFEDDDDYKTEFINPHLRD